MVTAKKFNKKILLLVPVIIIANIIYFNFIKKKDFLYVGTVETTKIDISSRITSVISAFPAVEGNKVKAGDMLVQMACEDIKQNYDSTQSDFSRGARLYKMGSLSQENYDHLKSKKDDMEIKLNWCTIKAASDAKVLNTYHEVGEFVTPGTKLLTLVDLSEVWIIIYVPQPMLAKISTGKKVTAYLPELDMRPFEGKITYISDVAEFTPKNVQTREERTRLVYGVKITFPNPEEVLKPGMSLEAKLE